jgi:predicted ATPase/class 3 adenylate cyclase
MTVKVTIGKGGKRGGLPSSGVVAFVMTDVGGSTAMWARDRDAMMRAMERHDELVAQVFSSWGGRVLKNRGEGDSVFAVFTETSGALEAAAELQSAFSADPLLAGTTPLSVRIAVHAGEDYVASPGDYRGNVPNRCARIREAAHPGQVIASEAVWLLAREKLPKDLSLRSLGTHRLRDLALPETLYQLTGRSLRDDFPPPKALADWLHNLPVQLTSFVGRAREMEEIRALLERTRLVTLCGTGGCGKTRLALQVAAQAFDQFDRGVWLVDFSTIQTSDDVAAHICRELGVADVLAGETLAGVSKHLADQRCLLVLDNCEHVTAGVRDAVLYLLGRNPAIGLLATSRRPLDIPGEATYVVPGMSLPEKDAQATLDTLASYDGVRLFAERAAAQDRSFDLVEANAPAVAKLCAILDGLPFLIILAAATTHLLTPRQMCDDMGRLLNRKVGQGTGASERHATLDAALQWSYDLLSPEAQKLLARLVVFVGGWTLEAAEEVCSDESLPKESLLDTLDELVRQSLVNSEAGPGEARRFRLLETTRRFASEKPADRAGLSQAHFRYYHALSLKPWGNTFTEADATWFAILDADFGNLATALQWGYAAQDPSLPEFVRALTTYWMQRGKLRVGREWLEKCTDYSGQDASARARSLNSLGALCLKQGDYPKARDAFVEALGVLETACSAIDVAIVYSNLAGVSSHLGDLSQARTYFEQSRRAFEAAGARQFLVRVLINLGVLDLDTGRWDEEVCANFAQAAQAAADLGDTAMVAVATGNLGETLLRMGRVRESVEALRKAFSVWQTNPDPTEIATSLVDVARISAGAGLIDDALRLLRMSDALFAEVGSKLTERQAKVRDSVMDLQAQQAVTEVASDPAEAVAEAIRRLDAVEALETCEPGD